MILILVAWPLRRPPGFCWRPGRPHLGAAQVRAVMHAKEIIKKDDAMLSDQVDNLQIGMFIFAVN